MAQGTNLSFFANTTDVTGNITTGTFTVTNNLIVSSGSVGIGTNSPAVKLDVNATSAIVNATWAGGTDFVKLVASSGSSYSEQSIAFQETGANIGAKIGVKNTANGAYSIIFANRDTSSLTSTLTEKLRIDSNGNVGIGTSSPRFKLSIGSTTSTSTATPDTLDLGGTYSSTAGTNPKLRVYWDGTSSYGFGVSPSQLDYLVPSGSAHVWYSAGSERMRIDSSGNVGIGGAPSYLLDIQTSTNATSVFRNYNASVGAVSQVVNQLNAGGRYVNELVDYTNQYYNLSGSNITTAYYDFNTQIWRNTGGGTERLRITANGGISFGASGTAYGTTGQKLVSNGDAAPTWGSSIVSSTAVGFASFTTTTYHDFTGIPSWVKRITLIVSGLNGNASASFLVQLGSGSAQITGYLSYWGYFVTSAATSSSAAGFGMWHGGSGDILYGHMTLTNLTGNTWVSSHSGGFFNGATAYVVSGGGNVTLSGVLDRIRITSVGGTQTWTAGTLNILYE